MLTGRERDLVMPRAGTGQQYLYLMTRPQGMAQRLAVSLLGVVASQALGTVVVPVATYFAWGPVVAAARSNGPGRRARFAGVWWAEVLDRWVEEQGGAERGLATGLKVGDGTGARVEVRAGFREEHREVEPGDVAALTVLSATADFADFGALREAFVPGKGVWVADYPFVNRRAFARLVSSLSLSE